MPTAALSVSRTKMRTKNCRRSTQKSPIAFWQRRALAGGRSSRAAISARLCSSVAVRRAGLHPAWRKPLLNTPWLYSNRRGGPLLLPPPILTDELHEPRGGRREGLAAANQEARMNGADLFA